ncbi:MAG: YdeI/OmpD-associated family protein [Thermomicrobiales bacterium]
MGWPPDPGDSGEHPKGGQFVYPADLAGWRAWLDAHHASERQVWLILPKKECPQPGISLSDAVDEALCWGWIDSRPGTVDAVRWSVTVTPRTPGGKWSAVHRRRIGELLAAGRVAAPGLASIAASRKDGSWSALDSSEALQLPVDLLNALSKTAAASEGWAAFPPATRTSLVHWMQDSRRSSIRAERVRQIVRGAKVGKPPVDL